MYDRKTWIVLLLCGGLLAANLYFTGQKNRAEAEARAKEQAEAKPNGSGDADFLAKAATSTNAELTVETPPPSTEEELIVLQNDRIAFTLTNLGAGIKFAELQNEYDVGSKTSKVRCNRFGTGPIGALADSERRPINQPFSYKAEDSVPGKKAVYIAKLNSGLIAKKTYSLVDSDKPGAPYLIDFKLELENTGTTPVPLGDWSLFLGEATPLFLKEMSNQTGFFWRENSSIHFKSGDSFKGGWFSSAKSLITSDNDEAVQLAGVTNQFFATVIQPKTPALTRIWGKASQIELEAGQNTVSSVRSGIHLPAKSLDPAQIESLEYRIFIGPKHNPLLRKMESHWGEGWGDVMQYGWFWFVSRPLNFLLNSYHNLIDGVSTTWSWGLAIILLTITVRIVIWPLHAKSTRTMKRMSKLKPEMDKLREKYADDPNKLNMETMGLYRKYGINPVGGCLPMFLQIPIFFGFYRMLQYAVELRGKEFLWVPDLSQPDHTWHLMGVTINLLPILMAASSFVQMRMTPSTGDKMQQRIMLFMPLMFFFFCYNFASALALYWTTQNIFSIGQTWLMGKMPEPELKANKNASKKSWVQRMAEKQAEAQKARQQGGMRDVTPKKKRGPRTGG